MNKFAAPAMLSLCLVLRILAETPGVTVEEIGALPKGVSKLQFVSRNKGWLMADGVLWATSDGGGHWSALNASGHKEEVFDFQMLSERTGWIRDRNGRVVRTNDGWKHSTAQCLIPQSMRNGTARTLWFDSSFRSGWVSGDIPLNAIDSVPAIYRTENGGGTWKHQAAPDVRNGKTVVLTVASPQTAVGVTAESVVTTQDGGAHWNKIFIDDRCSRSRMEDVGLARLMYQPFDQSRPAAVAFADQEHGWISDGRGYLIGTRDGGRTWCDVDRDSTKIKANFERRGPIAAMAFLDAKNGYALFDREVGVTRDGGLSWATVAVKDSLEGFVTADSKTIWAYSSNKLYRVSDR